jgi:biopolymer transport protein ExbD
MILDVNSQAPKQSNDDNLIPLINVVFLMLIFFMVAGHIQASDGVDVSPPSSTNEKDIVETPITIVATNNSELYTKGAQITESDLTLLLEQHVLSVKENEQLALQLKVDGALAVEDLQDILLLIKSSGIQHISLVTQSLEQAEQ